MNYVKVYINIDYQPWSPRGALENYHHTTKVYADPILERINSLLTEELDP